MVSNYFVRAAASFVGLALLATTSGQEPIAPAAASNGSPVTATLIRLASKTLGGEQFWADEFIHAGWRIQRHAISGHYRLLDPGDYRRAVGTYDTCHAQFLALQRAEEIQPPKKRAVVLLHGLLRSRATMQPLADYLGEQGDFEVVNVSYPSTRGTVEEHAASLALVLDRLEGVEEVHFVAHSLGNLVIRRWMHEHCRGEAQPRFRLGRFVMLGPPNRGAALAAALEGSQLFRMVTGQSGKQLAGTWDDLDDELSIPPCEFGIVAGIAEVTNPLVPGNDDFIVGIEETKLPGAADFRAIPVNHAAIRNVEHVGQITLHFLEHGAFGPEDERVSIPR
jgi:pimeloyl-ACP methyl ester carboxylesterase